MQTALLKEFLNSKQPIPIFRKIPLRKIDPFDLYQRLARWCQAVLLESIKGPDQVARYSFIAADPFLTLEAKGTRIQISEGPDHLLLEGHPIKLLSSLLTRFHVSRLPELPPFFGGAAGFFGYDFVHLFEKLPRTALDDLNMPDLYLGFFETVLAIDHVEQSLYLIFCPNRERFLESDRLRLYSQGVDKLNEIESWLASPPPPPSQIPFGSPRNIPSFHASLSRDEYIERVRRCQAYISQGDIFQANLSLRLSTPLGSCSPVALYSLLRKVNPAPFAALMNVGDAQILSSSPERLVRVEGRQIETRPIAGTRPRGKDLSEDHRLTVDLLTHHKERAEHLMLVDLERNDLGRVCEYGTLKVDEFMVTERYSHVMHIVSNIRGILKEELDCLDVLRAVFPGGTITGVPKIRCMEIIDELEPVRRGPYTGSIGYISFAGDMDLNIIIRSILMKNGMAHVYAGAGIVADSRPDQEYQECLYKAEALLKAIRMAQQP